MGKRIYADTLLVANCANGTYSVANRSGNGKDGDGYRTITEGVANMRPGDTLSIRSGKYYEDRIYLNFKGEQETVIEAFNGESVTIIGEWPGRTTFGIVSGSENITIRGIAFLGTLLLRPTEWKSVLDTPNIWYVFYDKHAVTKFDINTVQGTQVGSIAALDTPQKFFHDWQGTKNLYIYSTGNPNTMYTSREEGTNITDGYAGMAIGGTSGGGGKVTVENCRIEGFSHCGIKGGFRWNIRKCVFDNIGTDFNDHHIYAFGRFSEGNEAVYEYNYFGHTPGAAIHLYTDPSYHIFRYNVIDGRRNKLFIEQMGFWGVLLAGEHHTITNNTIVGNRHGLMFFRNKCHDNLVANNLFQYNTNDISIDTAGGSNSWPTNLTAVNNFYGSPKPCTGCTDRTGSSGPDYTPLVAPPNIIDSRSQFISEGKRVGGILDFRLNPSSLCIDSGSNLGSGLAWAIHPFTSSEENPSLADQRTLGAGWEIGAFAHYDNTQLGDTQLAPYPV